jgi:hypothetical protein
MTMTKAERAERAELKRTIKDARRDIDRLRKQVFTVTGADYAADILAAHFAYNISKLCTQDPPERVEQNRAGMARTLRFLARGYRALVVVAHTSEVGQSEIARSVIGSFGGDPLATMDFLALVDEARETCAQEVVVRHGAADSVALARRMGARRGITPGVEVKP